MLIINFKNYKLHFRSFEICEKLAELKKKYPKANFVIAPNMLSIRAYIENLHKYNSDVPIIAQHCDNVMNPKSTGYINPEILKNLDTWGTLLNHSEHQVHIDTLRQTVSQCDELDLRTIVCFSNVSDIIKYATIKASFVAYEPSNLIGNSYQTDAKSVLESESENLNYLKTKLDESKILLGAGVKSETDFRKTYELGFGGILLSSVICENHDFFGKLEEMISFEAIYGTAR